MLPVSVLPVAGLLLGIGSAHFTWLPPIAVGRDGAVGRRDLRQPAAHLRDRRRARRDHNDGVAALAAVVGYAVLLATMGVMAAVLRLQADGRSWASSRSKPASSAASSSAAIAGWLFNRYFRIQLPPYLGFFAGKRFVPIVDGAGVPSPPASS